MWKSISTIRSLNVSFSHDLMKKWRKGASKQTPPKPFVTFTTTAAAPNVDGEEENVCQSVRRRSITAAVRRYDWIFVCIAPLNLFLLTKSHAEESLSGRSISHFLLIDTERKKRKRVLFYIRTLSHVRAKSRIRVFGLIETSWRKSRSVCFHHCKEHAYLVLNEWTVFHTHIYTHIDRIAGKRRFFVPSSFGLEQKTFSFSFHDWLSQPTNEGKFLTSSTKKYFEGRKFLTRNFPSCKYVFLQFDVLCWLAEPTFFDCQKASVGTHSKRGPRYGGHSRRRRFLFSKNSFYFPNVILLPCPTRRLAAVNLHTHVCVCVGNRRRQIHLTFFLKPNSNERTNEGTS